MPDKPSYQPPEWYSADARENGAFFDGYDMGYEHAIKEAIDTLNQLKPPLAFDEWFTDEQIRRVQEYLASFLEDDDG